MAEETETRKLAAEAIGTGILVVIGCGSVALFAAAGQNAGFVSTTTSVALAFGIAIVLAVYAFGRISGGHFNPAVSTAAAVAGRISWSEAIRYMVAQVIGATVGAFLLFLITAGFDYNSFQDGGIGANAFGDDGSGISWWSAGILEILLTAIFTFAILAITDQRNDVALLAPLAIGLALAGVHFVGIPATGTSVNPARSIGPALFSGGDAMADLWLFILAPLVGGLLAGIAYPAIFGMHEEPVPGSGLSRQGRQAPPPPTAAPSFPGTEFQEQWTVEEDADATETGQLPPQPDYAPGEAPTGGASATPAWQQPKPPEREGELPVYEQDGWRWDYAKQQWVPIEE